MLFLFDILAESTVLNQVKTALNNYTLLLCPAKAHRYSSLVLGVL